MNHVTKGLVCRRKRSDRRWRAVDHCMSPLTRPTRPRPTRSSTS